MTFKRLKPRAGQAILLLLSLLIAMAMLSFWVLDIRSFIMNRLIAQDGGDAAALAAARWQAAGLNLCGELNLIQAYMLTDDKENVYAAQALHELRLRVQLTTPILAAHAAQLVAEENDLPEIPDGTKYVREFRDSVLLDGFYEGAEEDLREMLILLARDPIRAVPMSGIFEDSEFHNYLIDETFYDAILSRNWCYFYKNPFLKNYSSRKDFGPVPKMRMAPFFDLRLSSKQSSLDRLEIINTLSDQLTSIGHPPLQNPTEKPENELTDAERERYVDQIHVIGGGSFPIQWTIYEESDWREWTQMHPGNLPIQGHLKEGYDYDGANIALAVQLKNTYWIATAKAFGRIGRESPATYGLALGGFEAVRLVPVDSTDLGTYDFNFAWLTHIRHHIQPYMDRGSSSLEPGCRYCDALRLWGSSEFRHSILVWLAKHGHTCTPPVGPGPGDSGGTRYGH